MPAYIEPTDDSAFWMMVLHKLKAQYYMLTRRFRLVEQELLYAMGFFNKAVATLERENIKFRLDSGRELYKRSGGKLGRKIGYLKSKEQKQEQYTGVIKLLKKGYPVRNIAKIEGVGISTVMRLKKEFCE